jgi:hypothetical protein
MLFLILTFVRLMIARNAFLQQKLLGPSTSKLDEDTPEGIVRIEHVAAAAGVHPVFLPRVEHAGYCSTARMKAKQVSRYVSRPFVLQVMQRSSLASVPALPCICTPRCLQTRWLLAAGAAGQKGHIMCVFLSACLPVCLCDCFAVWQRGHPPLRTQQQHQQLAAIQN